MSEKKESCRAPCEGCGQKTNHEILCKNVERGEEDYEYALHYEVLKCLGCNRKMFRKIFYDLESSYPINDHEWHTPEDIEYYPKFIENYRELDGISEVPNLVKEIYSESLAAYREDALTLAGLGLRGTIEAICNERQITGKTLDVRISRLATQGLISTADAGRLHAIRFLGNDAAHDIKKPSIPQIKVALKIIEHLIQSIYILDVEATGKLDTIVSKIDDLKEMLDKKLKEYSAGDEFPIAKFLGKDLRRLGSNLTQLEAELISEIQSGKYLKFTIGKIDHYASSKDSLQHFIVK